MNRDKKTLFISALRAKMGTWMYYIGFMKMQDIAERVNFFAEESVPELSQPTLSAGTQEIENLLIEEQRFLNSLVVGTYGGNPQWYELAIRVPDFPEDEEEQIEALDGTIGFLRLDGTETLFTLAGHYQIAGIKQALSTNPELANEEVSIIFVTGVPPQYRESEPTGFERTRELSAMLEQSY